jgi:hypothetical protein
MRAAATDPPYHDGELRVQERAGVRAMADKVARVVRPELSAQAADFLAQRTLLAVASVAGDGAPWSSLLWGAPGFVTATDPRAVRIAAAIDPADPLAANLRAGAPLALLAIELATRQRLRVNGVAERDGEGVLTLRVREAYPNCPKYIQARQPAFPDAAAAAPGAARTGDTLTPSQQAWIAAADTLFLATAHPERGADASHRGGAPGFVRIEGASRLVLPDYAGNSMFNTLGNLEVTRRIGVAVPDFARGAVLQLSGEAEIDWDPSRAAAAPGAERLVVVRIARVVERDGVLPARWVLRERSPHNPPASLR